MRKRPRMTEPGDQRDDPTTSALHVLNISEETLDDLMSAVKLISSTEEVRRAVPLAEFEASGPISGTNCEISGGKFNPNDFKCKDSD
jgi:hypothetical protein